MMNRFRPTGICLALLAALGVCGCDVFTSSESRLARASEALEEGQPASALADARIVAEKDPDHPGGWLMLARLSLKYGDGEGALKDLERAASAGATAAEVGALRFQALQQANRFDDILALPAGTPDQQVVRATALAARDRRDEAAEQVAAVLAADPQHVEARLLNVRLLAADGNDAGARHALDLLLADEPGNSHAALLKARFALADGDKGAAAASLEQAAAGAARQLPVPDQIGLLAALTETLLAGGQPHEASAALVRLRGLAPKSPAVALLSARLSMAQGDSTTAVATLQRTLAEDPKQTPARLLLGTALIEQGANEQARSHLTSLVAEQPDNLAARRLLARVLAAQGDASAAERVLSEVPQGVPTDASTEWMRSTLLAATGKQTEALAALELAAKTDPSNAQLQLELVRAYLATGRQDLAQSTLQAIPPQREGMIGRQVKVLQRVMGQSGDELKKSLVALAQENPADAELRTVIGQTLFQLGDTPAAAIQFQGALAARPALTEARLGLAGVLTQQGNLDAAVRELRRVAAEEPSSERAHLGLAMIAMRRNNSMEARKWLEQAISAVPAAIAARMVLAEISYREDQPAAADALLEQMVTVSRDKPTALQQAGEVQLRAGQPARAAASFERAYAQRPGGPLAQRLYTARNAAKQPQPESVLRDWLKTRPDDAAIRTVLADHLLQQGEYPQAIAEYERATERAPLPAALNNLAWLYQTTGDKRAEATAKRAYEAAPGNPQIADTYGWILLEKGRVADALPLLTKAAQALPDDAAVQEHLKRARAKAGRE